MPGLIAKVSDLGEVDNIHLLMTSKTKIHPCFCFFVCDLSILYLSNFVVCLSVVYADVGFLNTGCGKHCCCCPA